jgi:S-formylglutathione hydrolase FrmB
MSTRQAFRTIEVSDPALESDGLRWVTVKSAALRRRADLSLWIPEEGKDRAMPLVILLHGVYGSHWAWALKGAAHRTAAELIRAGEIPPMVLAMPSDGLWGDGSGYARHSSGEDYAAWIMREVPEAARAAVPELPLEQSVFLSGLSMGGYGALRLAALHGGAVRAASAHSAVTSFQGLASFAEEDLSRCGIPAEEDSLAEIMRARRGQLPPFRFDCGTDDALLGDNRELAATLSAAGIPHQYEEFPGGHEWPYWRRHFADSLRFFARYA